MAKEAMPSLSPVLPTGSGDAGCCQQTKVDGHACRDDVASPVQCGERCRRVIDAAMHVLARL